jgi:hypothetical protein
MLVSPIYEDASMIHTMSGTQALQRRRAVKSPGTGMEHWGTEYFGPRHAKEIAPGPQSLLTEMCPHETILAHFHAVNQFQIYAAGSGQVGRHEVQPLVLQFLDHHTAYGPIVAGPQGLSFFALRVLTDSGPVYLDKPGYREKLKPSKRRSPVSATIVLSTEPVLENRKAESWEPLLATEEDTDGMAAYMLRLGSRNATIGPDPKSSGGYYLFVANGSLAWKGENLPLWSMVVVEPNEERLEISAGDKGLEALIMQYPRDTA